ncbi:MULTISPECIES: YihY/virulence factor BrkB family protein [unclassified Curtobacterium]|uniref:YihY/virulence factor BrkB family protein n=1 Tax=unclassified Curtobacterium TaxID=257496 RepID=UPI000DA9134F|nr:MULTISPECIES: YihY/virulence factor BrkB family protein [unclassified Curtobacterium]PZE27976.1 ribonuclease BN [Curtobacterium sp. MCBD17_028]PZE78262.1 ribonuclease BN [Curtobacterium sp. MCBD17_019]PZF62424.1 ribonuclease BN [Curtobacterium sp. MCBD17_034]PZF63713.1 ribonuclease BN [Curtobacterium sp. MCBD17_013]PZM39870.1 ribonuclease BN [Curtobacterium sp. MCBD17_031]
MARNTAPDPDDPRKPDDPTDLTKPSWQYTLKKTLREFSSDQCTDLAAGLTYHAVLAVFPAILAIVSILGLFGEGQATVDQVMKVLGNVGSNQVVDLLKGPINGLVRSPAAPLAFIVGVLGALWSASGYVGSFGRAMNRIYGIREGRPIWKLRPTMLGVTVFTVVLLVIGALMLVLSGPVAEAVGNAIGLGSVAVTVWDYAKLPILAAIAVVIIAILYYWSPNVRQPKFRWMSLGALLALLIWIIASIAFAFYVANFSHYNKTYGSLGGVIVFLLWIWITNCALLFGAEFDAEVERGRELQAGIHAEEDIQLPERDTRQIDKQDEKHAKDVLSGIEIRESAGREK